MSLMQFANIDVISQLGDGTKSRFTLSRSRLSRCNVPYPNVYVAVSE